jgi:hypothetical protein
VPDFAGRTLKEGEDHRVEGGLYLRPFFKQLLLFLFIVRKFFVLLPLLELSA